VVSKKKVITETLHKWDVGCECKPIPLDKFVAKINEHRKEGYQTTIEVSYERNYYYDSIAVVLVLTHTEIK